MEANHSATIIDQADAMQYFARRVDSYASEATRRNYGKFLSAFSAFAGDSLGWDAFDDGFLDRYEAWQRERGLSDTYIHKNIQTLRSLYNAACRDGVAPATDIFRDLPVGRPAARQVVAKPSLRRVVTVCDDGRKHWYALKLFRTGPDAVEAVINADEEMAGQIETYTPRQDVVTTLASGRTVTRRDVPVMRSLLFVRSLASVMPSLSRVIEGRAMVYSRVDADRRRRPAIISDIEMNEFRLVATNGREGLQYYAADRAPRFEIGQRVRVTDGPFKDLTGTIATLDDGTRHLSVTISGLCLVMTPAIPAPFLQPLD